MLYDDSCKGFLEDGFEERVVTSELVRKDT